VFFKHIELKSICVIEEQQLKAWRQSKTTKLKDDKFNEINKYQKISRD